jgi:hypothetical protein
MSIGLIVIITALWSLVGVKTWAFGITDLADEKPDRLSTLSYAFVGILWPLTFLILSIILIFGVNSQSLRGSISTIKKALSKK